MAYVHQTIKNFRDAVRDLSAQRHVAYRDCYAIEHLIGVAELLVYGNATTPELESAIQDLERALELAMRQRDK